MLYIVYIFSVIEAKVKFETGLQEKLLHKVDEALSIIINVQGFCSSTAA